MADSGFTFVVSNGPKLQADPQVRAVIRKHAMKRVAMTRKRRVDRSPATTEKIVPSTKPPMQHVVDSSSGGPCLIYPSDHSNCETAENDDSIFACWSPSTNNDAWHQPEDAAGTELILPAQPPGTPYEAARSWFQVDLNDFAMLTNFNVGPGSMSLLSAEPRRLLTLLGQPQWSYMQFVPSRYGASRCLTTAVDCVLAKLRGLVMPTKKNEALELRLLTVALRALQGALGDGGSSKSSEVLCASQLLSLHALLGAAQSSAWSNHIQGSTRLIQHRTPEYFKESFDKALLASHVGPIVMEAIVSRKPCWLDEPHWMSIYQSLANQSDSLTDRSPLVILARSQMIRLPRLWHDIDNFVRSPDLFCQETEVSLQTRCRSAHQSFAGCLEDYRAYCTKTSLSKPSPKELAIRRELYGMIIECLAVVKRLLATVCNDLRPELEREAQELAESLQAMHKEESPKYSWLFARHEKGVANSITSTKALWEGVGLSESHYERCFKIRERYTVWTAKLHP